MGAAAAAVLLRRAIRRAFHAACNLLVLFLLLILMLQDRRRVEIAIAPHYSPYIVPMPGRIEKQQPPASSWNQAVNVLFRTSGGGRAHP